MNFYFRKEPWEQVPIEIIRNEVSSTPLVQIIEVQKKRRDVDGNVVLVDGSPVFDTESLEVTSHISLGVEPTPEQLEPYGYCVVKDCPEVTAQPWQDIVETFEVDSEGYYQRVLTVVDNLQKAKEYKLAEINNNYQTDKSQPVEIGGVFYKGGMESAQAIKSLVDLVTYMGGEECLIQPVDSEPLLLSLEDSLTVAATIGYAYQTVYIKKERLCRDILACESVEQVLGIKWSEVE